MLFIINKKGKLVKFDSWLNIPEPIAKMGYKISPTKSIMFEGFERYVRIKENVTGINVKVEKVSKIVLMGQTANKVMVISLDLKSNKLTQEERVLGFEYENKPVHPKFWKKGLGGQAKISIEDI